MGLLNLDREQLSKILQAQRERDVQQGLAELEAAKGNGKPSALQFGGVSISPAEIGDDPLHQKPGIRR